MAVEWAHICKDCGKEFQYSNTTYERGRDRGHSRPERCEQCRRQHAREIHTVGQPFFKVKPLKPGLDHTNLTSILGRLNHGSRELKRQEFTPPPLDPDKFGVTDASLLDMFGKFEADPGLQVIVVIGPTGSGKSTVLPYRLLDPPILKDNDGKVVKCVKDQSMFHRYGQIVVTQPRIQATRSIPKFIADKMVGCSLGAGFDVGFRHSHAPSSDWNTKLAFVTDGTLVNWLATGQLDKINTIMIDEAHERSLNIDIIMGMLTQVLPRYPRLRVIIASATIAADTFIKHFDKHLPARFGPSAATVTLHVPHRTGSVILDTPSEFDRARITVCDAQGQPLRDQRGKPRTPLEVGSEAHKGQLVELQCDQSGQYQVTAEIKVKGRWRPAHLRSKWPSCELAEFPGKSFSVSPHFMPTDKRLSYKHVELDQGRTEGRYEKPDEIHVKVADKAVEILTAMYDTTPDGGFICDDQGQKIDITERRGDILCFLHGEKPIKKCVQMLKSAKLNCMVTALPLYTTLPQDEQDAALSKPLSIADQLRREVKTKLGEMASSGKLRDILVIYNNAGQIDQLVEDVGTDMVNDRSLAPMKGKVGVYPLYTSQTAKQLFPTMPERHNLRIPAKGRGVPECRVVVSTWRASSLLDGSEFVRLDVPDVHRRVVISTNVAETSLTIHGILHVIDSGLIKQDKWDLKTQTSTLSPILQSRAGCKQRWGRAGRLQAGDSWMLYTKEQFGNEQGDPDTPERCFAFYSTPEIQRSSLEQVMLTAKAAGVDSLDPQTFPWIDAPDPRELERSLRSLQRKKALDSNGDLTDRGLEIGRIRQETKVANMIIVADRLACAVEMATILAVSELGMIRLFKVNNDWDEQTRREVQAVQESLVAGCEDDLEAALKICACWSEALEGGRAVAAWASRQRQERPTGDLSNDYGTPAHESLDSAYAKVARFRRRWDNIFKGWAWEETWDVYALQHIRRAIACDQVLAVVSRTAATPESRLAALEQFIADAGPAQSHEKAVDAARRFLNQVDKTKDQGRLRNHCAAMVREIDRLGRLRVVPNGSPRARFLHAAASIQTPEDVRHLVETFGQGPLREWTTNLCGQLGLALAAAWARTHYIDERAMADKVEESFKTLMEPLTGHKKEEERRPLDFSRLDRLRLVIAYCLPDHCYVGKSGGYHLAVSSLNPPGDSEDTASSIVGQAPDPSSLRAAEEFVVDIDSRSVCTDKDLPAFACLSKRSVRKEGKKQGLLLCSFIVRVRTEWLSTLASQEGKPLHEYSLMELVALLSQTPPLESPEQTETRLFLDQDFPCNSVCACSLVGSTSEGKGAGTSYESELLVSVQSPKRLRSRIVERAKKANGEVNEALDADLGEASDASSPKDLKLTKDLERIKASCDTTEIDTAEDEAAEWEALFAYTPAPEQRLEELDDGAGTEGPGDVPCRDETGTEAGITSLSGGRHGASSPAIALAGARPSDLPHRTTDSLSPQSDSSGLPPVPGLLSCSTGVLEPAAFASNGVIEAEVYGYQFGPQGTHVCLRCPLTDQQFDMFVTRYGERDMELPECELEVVRLDALSLSRGAVLVVREVVTGLEATMGARDLSFSGSVNVPRVVYESVGKGNRFRATLAQIDRVARRVRFTTHLQGESLLYPNGPRRELGSYQGEVIEVSPSKTSVRLIMPEEPERRGIVVVAGFPAGQLPGAQVGHRVAAQLSLSIRNTLEQWPAGKPFPVHEELEQRKDESKVRYRGRKGPVTVELLREWLSQVTDPACRTALYNIYERSNQLDGTDEQTVEHFKGLLDKELMGVVTSVTDDGAEIQLEGCADIQAWMWNNEVSWDFDARAKGTLTVGERRPVRVVGVSPTESKVTVSIRRLTPSPYKRFKIGQAIKATALNLKTRQGGGKPALIGIDLAIMAGVRRTSGVTTYRLSGWMPADELACLPGMELDEVFAAGKSFDATVIEASEDGLVVSARPNILCTLRDHCLGRVITGRVARILTTKSGKEVEAHIEITPGVIASLPINEMGSAFVPSMSEIVPLGSDIQCVLKRVDLEFAGVGYRRSVEVSRRDRLWAAYRIAPESRIGLFIGRGGANVKSISEQHQAKLSFRKNTDTLDVRADTERSFDAACLAVEAHARSIGGIATAVQPPPAIARIPKTSPKRDIPGRGMKGSPAVPSEPPAVVARIPKYPSRRDARDQDAPNVSRVVPPKPHRAAPPPKSAPSVEPPPKGLVARVFDFFRRAF